MATNGDDGDEGDDVVPAGAASAVVWALWRVEDDGDVEDMAAALVGPEAGLHRLGAPGPGPGGEVATDGPGRWVPSSVQAPAVNLRNRETLDRPSIPYGPTRGEPTSPAAAPTDPGPVAGSGPRLCVAGLGVRGRGHRPPLPDPGAVEVASCRTARGPEQAAVADRFCR